MLGLSIYHHHPLIEGDDGEGGDPPIPISDGDGMVEMVKDCQYGEVVMMVKGDQRWGISTFQERKSLSVI
jgi:hypothetical protein